MVFFFFAFSGLFMVFSGVAMVMFMVFSDVAMVLCMAWLLGSL